MLANVFPMLSLRNIFSYKQVFSKYVASFVHHSVSLNVLTVVDFWEWEW